MDRFKSIEKLCNIKNSFDFSLENENLFIEAMKENYKFQLESQPYIEFLRKSKNIDIDNLKTIEDIYNIPPLFVGTLKINRFCNIQKKDIELILTSSGTKGQKTQLIMDKYSLKRLETLAYNTFDNLGFSDSEPVHYIVFGYNREKAKEVGTSWSDEQDMKYAPKKSVTWVINWDNKTNSYKFDAEYVAKQIIELHLDAPLRIIGFPAFIYQTIEIIKRLKPDIKVNEKSFILAGGGWKNHKGDAMTHEKFSIYIEKNIGLKKENVRDSYGMAEHGVPYTSCSFGHHHIPIYGRLRTVDPVNMKTTEYGEEGLLHLFTPYNTAQPNLSVLSTDLVILKKDCKCGLKGEYIASIRRGGKKKHKGCAIAAQEILSKSSK